MYAMSKPIFWKKKKKKKQKEKYFKLSCAEIFTKHAKSMNHGKKGHLGFFYFILFMYLFIYFLFWLLFFYEQRKYISAFAVFQCVYLFLLFVCMIYGKPRFL